jgi:NADH-quinone oxidoreductase subunit N
MVFSITDIVAVLPEIIVVAGACTIILAALVIPRGEKKDIIAYLAIGVVLLAAWGSFRISGFETTAFSGMFAHDGYSCFFKFVFYIGTVLSIMLSMHYVKVESINVEEYYILMLFSLSGMMVIASGADLLTIYLGLELMSLPIYVLVGFLQRDIKSNEAAMKYIVLGAFSSGILLFGISLVYGVTGTTQLVGIAAALHDPALHVPAFTLAVIMLVAGFGFKIAGAPFHMWAPDAYEGAPTPITAFMSVGVKAAAFAAVLRVFVEALSPVYDQWQVIVALVSVASLVVGNVVAIAQTNIKRMLAYSSIGHAGYALLGLVAGTAEGVAAVLFYMLVYTLMNLGAFGVIITMRKGSQIGDNIEDYAGLAKTNRALALVMLIFFFSLAGIPPTAGFVGKFYIFMALIHKGMVPLAVIAVIMSAVAAYYYIRIVMVMYMREPKGEFLGARSMGIYYVLALATVAVIVMGIYPRYFIELAQRAVFIL